MSGNLDYVSDSKSVTESDSPKFAKYLLYLIFLVIIFAFLWAYFSNIEIVANGKGKVVASANLQVIQNLEGGIVDKIYVKEGEKVKKGQELLRLDDTIFAALYKEDAVKAAVLKIQEIRLHAEVANKQQLFYPIWSKQEYPELVQQAKILFLVNNKSLETKLNKLRDKLELTLKEYNILSPLAEQGVVSQIEKIRLERNINQIENEIELQQDEAMQKKQRELTQVRADQAVLKESLAASKDRLTRTNMRSPVDGIVNQIHITTEGEVVKHS